MANYTPILRLTVDPSLTEAAKTNLFKIDALGRGVFTDGEGVTKLRSPASIDILPDDASVGGDGIGGAVNFGSESQELDAVTSFAASTRIMGYLDLNDQDVAGGSFLRMRYLSTSLGAVEVTSRILTLDVGDSDRSLVLNADLRTGVSYLGVGPLNFTLPAIDDALVGAASAAVLTNKSIDAASNTLTNISNSAIAVAAGISYSKLSLTGSIVTADLAPAFALPYAQLSLTGSIVDGDISPTAAISYSKLSLVGSITGADIATGAAIPYSKLLLTGTLVDADISPSAAISGSKITPEFSVPVEAPAVDFVNGSRTRIQAAPQVADVTLTLPPELPPGPGFVLSVSETGVMSYSAAGAGTVSSVDLNLDGSTSPIFSVMGGPITASGALTLSLDSQLAGTILAAPAGSDGTPTFREIEATDIESPVQAVVTGMADDSANVTLTGGSTLVADLTDTAVTPGTYGTGSQVGTFTVDSKGRLTAASNIPVSISSANISDAGMAGGIATLDDTGKVPASQLPSFVDDVVEYANLAAFPVTGSTGIIYVALDTNKAYRWSGSIYVEVSPSDVNSVDGLLGSVVLSNAATWLTADGATKVITHSLGTLNVNVTLFEIDTGEEILIDSIVRTNTNTVTLTASEAPSGSGWRVVTQR